MIQHLKLKNRCQHLGPIGVRRSFPTTTKGQTPIAPSAEANWHMAKGSAGLGADTFSTQHVGITSVDTEVPKTTEQLVKEETLTSTLSPAAPTAGEQAP